MAVVTVRFFGGAARAAGTEQQAMEARSIGELRAVLSANPEMARVCAVASFLVDGAAAGENTTLSPGSTVDVLPPFAGG